MLKGYFDQKVAIRIGLVHYQVEELIRRGTSYFFHPHHHALPEHPYCCLTFYPEWAVKSPECASAVDKQYAARITIFGNNKLLHKIKKAGG